MVHIEQISWNRTFFELRYQSAHAEQLYLYRVKEQRFIPFETTMQNDGRYLARLNVVIVGDRAVLSAGQWIICKKLDDDLLENIDTLLHARPDLRARMERDVRRNHPEIDFDETPKLLEEHVRSEGFDYVANHPYDTHGITYAQEIINDLSQYSMVYRYAKNTYAYTVSLVAKANAEGALYIALEPEFFRRNKNPRVRRGSKIFTIKRIMRMIYDVIEVTQRHHRDGKRILFFKENGDHPTENMAALQQRMAEREIDKQFDITCRYHNVFVKHQSVFGWLADMAAIAKSDYIFVDDYTPIFNFITPADGVVLTQLWHAGVGFKSVGYARFGLTGSPDPYASGHRKYTYALVGNAGLRDIYSEVFGIEKEALLATGMPRLDHFLDDDVAERAREDLLTRYPMLGKGRTILFAPTFRGAGQRGAYYPYKFIDMDALYAMCVDTNSYFIFEMHHFITKPPEIDERYADRILDLSCESINELFHVSDVLVTDYSSCFYDYLLLDKPVVFFTPDRDVYSATRGVQRPVNEMAPGVVCDTFEDFIRVLSESSYESVTPDPATVDRARERSGLASDRIIDTILFEKDIPGVRLSS